LFSRWSRSLHRPLRYDVNRRRTACSYDCSVALVRRATMPCRGVLCDPVPDPQALDRAAVVRFPAHEDFQNAGSTRTSRVWW
jgi:hypothetical protein